MNTHQDVKDRLERIRNAVEIGTDNQQRKQQRLRFKDRNRKIIVDNDIPSEHCEQVQVVKWLLSRNIIFTAIPNGAHLAGGRMNRIKQMQFLKSEGLQKGFPDLLLISRPPKHKHIHGVVIEMKRVKGGVFTKEQLQWEHTLTENDWLFIRGLGHEFTINQLNEMGWL